MSKNPSTHSIDLDKYFERIGYSDSREPTLNTLKAIHWLHLKAFTFDNLDIAMGKNIFIDLPAIEEKLVGNKRGGYCFEQTVLLLNVLQQIGFHVTPLISRVDMGPAVITGNTHAILQITIDNIPWIVDVGFGPYGAPCPVQLNIEDIQQTFIRSHRMLHKEGRYTHQANIKGEWTDLYSFNLLESYHIDWEIANWWCSTSKSCFFTFTVLVARFTDSQILFMHNKHLSVTNIDANKLEGVVDRDIESREEYLKVLRDYFDTILPDDTVFTSQGLLW